jgi:hypothetical protein
LTLRLGFFECHPADLTDEGIVPFGFEPDRCDAMAWCSHNITSLGKEQAVSWYARSAKALQDVGLVLERRKHINGQLDMDE